ncbi:SPRY-domain-containing protein [Choiromyces venosus 120613-1]|uniref:SPRY-domain-containing protein n=1 Tax=Choiromyces venosus 120613-1 TaxID=1336337 RepID=A0A3N4JGX5_9PEZI|nr:SPRY-domain-containing protein [Choiromyces venosus 120613-1]
MSGSSSLRRSIVAPSSSYASVLSGQSRLSGFISELNHHNGTGVHSRHLPSSTINFPGSNNYAMSQNQAAQQPTIVPSYLAESSYAERLAARSAVFNPLPTPPSSLTLSGKVSQTHRGLACDVIENVSGDDDVLNPLPTRWNENDKCPGIDLLNNGMEVKFIGPQKVSDNDAAAVRADQPMPPQCGLFYYEVTVVSKGKEGLIGVGFCTQKVQLNRLPGWEPESWGYHGDDGNSFCCQGTGKQYGPQFSTNDIIGCGVNFRTGTAFFTKNGVELGTAFRDIKGKLYPAVGMKRPGEHVRVNFGQERFVFDIDHYMNNEKRKVYDEINGHPTAGLCPSLDEAALIQALVSQYLAHDGYVDTARAFSDDVQNESRALDSGRSGALKALEMKEDKDAIHRQKIRGAILEGDVDRALELTNKHYPDVLPNNQAIFFRLRCRKLVEMIRQFAETIHGGSTGSRNPHDDPMVGVFAQEMEIDDPAGAGAGWEEMDVEDEDGNGGVGTGMEVDQTKSALDAAVKYGKDLRVEFQSDTRPEIRKALEEAFSLLAYTDPKNSVLAHLLDEEGRVSVAEELNSAILVSMGKSSVAALERLVQQSTVLINELSEEGGPGAFVNLRNDYLRNDHHHNDYLKTSTRY